jgi:cystathionine beta-lyase
LHAYLNDRTVAKAPTDGPVIRLQIGIEDVADLKADIERGFAAASAI